MKTPIEKLMASGCDETETIYYKPALSCIEHQMDQLTYTALEVENLKRSYPSGYAYETRAYEVGAVQNAHFTVALGVFF